MALNHHYPDFYKKEQIIKRAIKRIHNIIINKSSLKCMPNQSVIPAAKWNYLYSLNCLARISLSFGSHFSSSIDIQFCRISSNVYTVESTHVVPSWLGYMTFICISIICQLRYDAGLWIFLCGSPWRMYSADSMSLYWPNSPRLSTRAPFQYPIRLLIVRTRKVSKAGDWVLKCSYRFEIWQTHQQQCCRGACQF